MYNDAHAVVLIAQQCLYGYQSRSEIPDGVT